MPTWIFLISVIALLGLAAGCGGPSDAQVTTSAETEAASADASDDSTVMASGDEAASDSDEEEATPDSLRSTPNPESTEGRPWGQPLKKPAGAPLNLG